VTSELCPWLVVSPSSAPLTQEKPRQEGEPEAPDTLLLGNPENRVIESLRLEKTSKIIKSNRQHNTTVPAKPWPEVPRLHIF